MTALERLGQLVGKRGCNARTRTATATAGLQDWRKIQEDPGRPRKSWQEDEENFPCDRSSLTERDPTRGESEESNED